MSAGRVVPLPHDEGSCDLGTASEALLREIALEDGGGTCGHPPESAWISDDAVGD